MGRALFIGWAASGHQMRTNLNENAQAFKTVPAMRE